MTLFEVDEAANRIREEVDPEANIIFGSTFDENMQGRIRVSVVATGIAMEGVPRKANAHVDLGKAHEFSKAPGSAAETVTPRGFFTRKRDEEKAVEEDENDVFSANYRPAQHTVDQGVQQEQLSEMPPASTAYQNSVSESPTSVSPKMASEEKFEHSMPFSQHKTRKLGFFERVAETVRGARSQQEENTKPANRGSVHSEGNEVKVYTDMKDRQNSHEQDALEIPAFLRRRANNK